MTTKRNARRTKIKPPLKRRAKLRAVPPSKPTDPVSRYARAILDGKIVACRAVRQACKRHFRDYARQRTREFPYWFSPKAARHIIDFFPTFIHLEDGVTPMILAPWAQFCFGSMFGWRRVVDDGRRYQVGYIETAKGSGKSPYVAAVGLYGLAFDGEDAGEVYAAAFDKGQASIVLNDAIRMANASPDLAQILDLGKYNIAHVESGSFFRAVSSEHRSKSGPRPSIALIDELHEHRDGTVVNKMRAGFKGRLQPLMLEITNSGFDRTSICWQHHEHSMQVLDGTVTDEQWFGYVCHLDPCDACYAEGYREPREGCEHCDDWTDPGVWMKTNPSLVIGLPRVEYLQSQVDTALAMPADRALIKRLNFCCWTQAQTIWIPPDEWEACLVPAVSERNDCHACAAGFDMSEKLDLTAGVIAIRVEDEPDVAGDRVEIADSLEGEQVVKTLDLNFCIELIPFFWLPEETLWERVKKERIPFDVWKSRGHLRATPGAVIDHDKIYEEFTKDIGPRYHPQRVAYDPHNATQFAVALRDKAKYEIVEIQGGRRLSETFKLIQALVKLRRLKHAGNPVLSWCIANAEPQRDRFENLWFEKKSRIKRIDGLIAAANAINQLVLLPARIRSRKRRPAKIWTPDGFVPALPTNEGADART